jgi:large subunit ribosomal protein L29
MKAGEVHKLNDDELNVEVERLRRQIFDLRSQAVTEKLENPHQISRIRRDVARLLTEQRVRQQRGEVKAEA